MTLSVFDAARDAAGAVALIASGRAITWAELAARARAMEEPLLHEVSGFAPDVPVPIDATLTPGTLVGMHLLLAMQRPFAPLSPRLTPAERDAALATLGSAATPPGTLAVIATAGTTGRARFAVLSREAFMASARAHASNVEWRPEDRWLLCMPLDHVGGLSIVTRTLLARRAIVLLPAFDPRAVIDAIREHRVTLASLVPAMLERMLELGPSPRDFASLRAVLVGGAHAPPGLLARARAAGVPALATYGLTETCSQVTAESPRAAAPGAATAPGTSGAPLEGMELRIRDRQIEVRGPVLFHGYLESGAVTPPALEEGWFRTGDLGEFTADGRLVVLGRADDVIVTGGEKVHPLEVEDALLESGLVARVCVFGVPDERWGAVVAMAAVPAGEPPDGETLARVLAARLAPWKRPRRIAWLDHIPVTASGKPDRGRTARAAMPHLREIL